RGEARMTTPGSAEGGIGSPLPRPDGPAKVSGRAVYAGDDAPVGTLHGVLVTSSIAAGTVTAIDASQALGVNGVLQVLTHESMPRLAPAPVPPAAQSFTPMQDGRVLYEGQPIAIVIADTLEAAEEGAQRVRVTYQRDVPQMVAQAPAVEARSAQ